MDKEAISRTTVLICRYKSAKTDLQKSQIRNILFDELAPYLERWVGAALKKKGQFLESTEFVSFMWDCFLFCLDRFNEEKKIPIPQHFYRYIVYCVLTKIVSENHTPDFEEYVDEKEYTDEGGEDVRLFFSEISEFRSRLSENYKIIFDDALLSMNPERKNRMKRQEESFTSYYKYCEAKNIYKQVIEYFLSR